MAEHPGDLLKLSADLLVIGGGLAGNWTAAASRAGASVLLADKGYRGAAG